MEILRTAFAVGALAAWASLAWASDPEAPCKNHYILDSPCAPSVVPIDASATRVRVSKIFSTLDGDGQAVELEIVRVDDRPLVLTGRVLSVADRHGNVRAYPLDRPVGSAGYPFTTRSTVLLSTFADGWGPYADMVIPRGFLPIDGGTLSIGGMDEVAFGRLPEDGRHALNRDGEVVPADFGFWGSYAIHETNVVEFHDAALDHYFMTNRADEIALLRSGAVPGWAPTGKSFQVYAAAAGDGLAPVCRYLLIRPGGSSHFFSASPEECASLAGGAGNVLESTAAFFAGAPTPEGCGMATLVYPDGHGYSSGLEPIYRLWNGKADTNHRFVADKTERDAMIARGWILEGAGPEGIGMCGYASTWLYPWFGTAPPLR